MSVRVTQSMLNSDMMRNLSKSYKSLSKYQEQLSSGKKINRPSDDPVVAVRGMFHRSSLMEIEQFKRNANEGYSWMELTDESLDQVNSILQRARELTLQGSNDTYAQGSMDAIASEIDQLKKHLGEVANASIAGRYIFAGTETKEAPYQLNTGTGNMEFMNTNDSDIRLEMNTGNYVAINVHGTEIFDHNGGVFNVLDQITTDLQNGVNPGGNVADLDDQIDHILAERTSLGARMNRVELTIARLDQSEFTSKKLLSETEDADIAKVITELKAQENVHRAALSAGSRIIQPTLVDFLR